jgi:hypothetical protein
METLARPATIPRARFAETERKANFIFAKLEILFALANLILAKRSLLHLSRV